MALLDEAGGKTVKDAQAGIVYDIGLIRDLIHEVLDRFDGAEIQVTFSLRPRTPKP